METVEQLREKLAKSIEPKQRDSLLAKGLARGMIWSEGDLPPDSPRFSSQLTNDLLNHGYTILGATLRLMSLSSNEEILDDAFRTAAEAIEAAVRNGAFDENRGFHLVIAAAAFHLGHYAARSFSLLEEDIQSLNLSSTELLLVCLLQRRLSRLEAVSSLWLNSEENSDEGVAKLLESDESDILIDDVSRLAIERQFHRAIAFFEFALKSGEISYVRRCVEILTDCVEASGVISHVPLWWICTLAKHLVSDLWGRSLYAQLPSGQGDDDSWKELKDRFIELLVDRDIAEVDLWPSQLAAVGRVMDQSDNLVVALPTSSGKTRIAELCMLRCLSSKGRVIYVTPLRALSAQVERSLRSTFGELGFTVSSVFGSSGLGKFDVDKINSSEIVVSTPEKLDFAIRQEPNVIDDVGLVVLDEGHMIGLNEREIRYEILVQRLLRRPDSTSRRIVCLSAIFSDGDSFDDFGKWICQNEQPQAIRSSWRPTRQRPATLEWQGDRGRLEYTVEDETVFVPKFVESQPPLGRRRKSFPNNRPELIIASARKFLSEGHTTLIYCPMRRSVEATSKSFLKASAQGYFPGLLSGDQIEAIQPAVRIGEEWLGSDHVALRALQLGIAVHHGQLPHPFLRELEQLLKRKLLPLAISSPTLAQGVDLSFSVLLFTSLWRNQKLIPAKEFANVIGRVGRAFVDLDGIFLLPVYEPRINTRQKRVREFHSLVKKATERELESGLYLLIKLCLRILRKELNIDDSTLMDYVLNQTSSIEKLASSDTETGQNLRMVLAELDAGILALIENLDCSLEAVSEQVDMALNNSYWERRILVHDEMEQVSQRAVLKGRARFIWEATTVKQRTGFFAASIGFNSGLAILRSSAQLRALLTKCEEGIANKRIDSVIEGCNELASILLSIHPFIPNAFPENIKDPEYWRKILSKWISGETLADLADSSDIAFIQDAVVYRLVWAVEAARIVLDSIESEDGPETNDSTGLETPCLAFCLTFGVPYMAAARLLEAGLESRLLSMRIVSELDLNFTSRKELDAWVDSVGPSEPVSLSEPEESIWKRFQLGRKKTPKRVGRDLATFKANFHDNSAHREGEKVRVLSDAQGRATIWSPDFQKIGIVEDTLVPNASLIAEISTSFELRVKGHITS